MKYSVHMPLATTGIVGSSGSHRLLKRAPQFNCLILAPQERGYVTADVAKSEDLHVKSLSGTKFRKMLRSGEDIPEWFAFKSVVDVLRSAAPASSG